MLKKLEVEAEFIRTRLGVEKEAVGKIDKALAKEPLEIPAPMENGGVDGPAELDKEVSPKNWLLRDKLTAGMALLGVIGLSIASYFGIQATFEAAQLDILKDYPYLSYCLALLRDNPAYRQVHENLMSSIRTVQTATQTTLQRVDAALTDKQELWDSKMSKAARLPDGTPVFKDKHGNVQTLDGETIPPEQAARIKWPDDTPLLEDMLLLQQDILNLEAARDQLLGIETELGEIYDRNNRNDKPATPDAMKRDTDRADDLGIPRTDWRQHASAVYRLEGQD